MVWRKASSSRGARHHSGSSGWKAAGNEKERNYIEYDDEDCDGNSTVGNRSTVSRGSISYTDSRSVATSVVGHDDPTAVIRNSHSRVRLATSYSTIETLSTHYEKTYESRNPDDDDDESVEDNRVTPADVEWRDQLISELDQTEEKWKEKLPVHLKRELPVAERDIMIDTGTQNNEAYLSSHPSAYATHRTRLSCDPIPESNDEQQEGSRLSSNSAEDDTIISMVEEGRSQISHKRLESPVNHPHETAIIVRQVQENNEIIRQVRKRLSTSQIPPAKTEVSTDESSEDSSKRSMCCRRTTSKCRIISIFLCLLLSVAAAAVVLYFLKFGGGDEDTKLSSANSGNDKTTDNPIGDLDDFPTTDSPVQMVPTLNPTLGPLGTDEPILAVPTMAPTATAPTVDSTSNPVTDAPPTATTQPRDPTLSPDQEAPSFAPVQNTAPTLSPITQSPIDAPVDLSPGPAPTSNPTTGQSDVRPPFAILQRLLGLLFPLSGVQLYDPTSPQFKAFQWLEKDDPFTMSVHTIPDKVIKERYIAAMFYFAMKGEQWDNTHGYLGGGSVCEWHHGSDGAGIFCTDDGSIESIVFRKCS